MESVLLVTFTLVGIRLFSSTDIEIEKIITQGDEGKEVGKGNFGAYDTMFKENSPYDPAIPLLGMYLKKPEALI